MYSLKILVPSMIVECKENKMFAYWELFSFMAGSKLVKELPPIEEKSPKGFFYYPMKVS